MKIDEQFTNDTRAIVRWYEINVGHRRRQYKSAIRNALRRAGSIQNATQIQTHTCGTHIIQLAYKSQRSYTISALNLLYKTGRERWIKDFPICIENYSFEYELFLLRNSSEEIFSSNSRSAFQNGLEDLRFPSKELSYKVFVEKKPAWSNGVTTNQRDHLSIWSII